jgi:adenine-specific DNA glycosylase
LDITAKHSFGEVLASKTKVEKDREKGRSGQARRRMQEPTRLDGRYPPWRRSFDRCAIRVFEIMLQQTGAERAGIDLPVRAVP